MAKVAAGIGPAERMKSIRATGRIYPLSEHARIVEATLVQDPPGVVREALGIHAGGAAIRRHRITFQGQTPVSVSTSWFAGALAEVAPLLLRTDRILQGTPGYIEECTGQRMAFGVDQPSAVLASQELAAELGVEVGSLVTCGRNWVRDGEGSVLEYGEYFNGPSRVVSYEYDLS